MWNLKYQRTAEKKPREKKRNQNHETNERNYIKFNCEIDSIVIRWFVRLFFYLVSGCWLDLFFIALHLVASFNSVVNSDSLWLLLLLSLLCIVQFVWFLFCFKVFIFQMQCSVGCLICSDRIAHKFELFFFHFQKIQMWTRKGNIQLFICTTITITTTRKCNVLSGFEKKKNSRNEIIALAECMCFYFQFRWVAGARVAHTAHTHSPTYQKNCNDVYFQLMRVVIAWVFD